jgi:hypothetical protein
MVTSDRFTKMGKIRRLIDKIAYYSLILDISIATVTGLSILKIGNPEAILVPINYLLTIVVILSIGLFVALFMLKHEENILDTLLSRRYNYNHNSLSLLRRIKIKLLYDRNKRLSR